MNLLLVLFGGGDDDDYGDVGIGGGGEMVIEIGSLHCTACDTAKYQARYYEILDYTPFPPLSLFHSFSCIVSDILFRSFKISILFRDLSLFPLPLALLYIFLSGCSLQLYRL